MEVPGWETFVRPFGFLLKRSRGMAAPRIPAARQERLNQSFRRRLSDGIELLLDEACITNNLSAAADLLALLEKWHAGHPAGYGRERRINNATLQRARRDLERLRTLRGLRTACPETNLDGVREHVSAIKTAAPISDAWQNIIDRLNAEIESKNQIYQAALARISELEALLRNPIVRKTLLRALHPDTHPEVNDAERSAITAQFQWVSAELRNLGKR
jgi:hypothetical protein